MKVLKNDKYQAILQAARAEFICKGFKDASMRNIAKQSQVGVGNIYNYFTNKDEIYRTIVQPARDDFFTFITRQHTEENINFNYSSTFNYYEGMIEQYIDLIDRYKEELHLLLYQSDGSSMSSFREAFINHMTKISYDYMMLEKKYFPQKKEVSPFFIRAISSWMASILGEIITHDIDKPKIREFFREFFRFEFAGWQALTGT